MTMQRHLRSGLARAPRNGLHPFSVLLIDRSGTRAGDRLDLPMGRQDIASHLELTIETVCRAITEAQA